MYQHALQYTLDEMFYVLHFPNYIEKLLFNLSVGCVHVEVCEVRGLKF